jgi:hypothetical protein
MVICAPVLAEFSKHRKINPQKVPIVSGGLSESNTVNNMKLMIFAKIRVICICSSSPCTASVHLSKVFYHLVEVIFNLFASMFLTYVQIYQISVCLLMSHEKCPIWQVLFIIKFGTFAFFLYCTVFSSSS